jgi:hypothetical protein
MNNHHVAQSVAFLGLQPSATRVAVKERLERFPVGGDNHITNCSLGYRTQLGTDWDRPAGVVHTPGGVCTYCPEAIGVFCWGSRGGPT